MDSPLLRNEELCSTFLNIKYLHKLFGIILHEILSTLFVFNNLYHDLWIFSFMTYEYFLYVYNLIHFLFCFTNYSRLLPIGSCVLLTYPYLCVYVWGSNLPYISRLIFPTPALLEWAVSPRVLGVFYRSMVLEIKIWVLRSNIIFMF